MVWLIIVLVAANLAALFWGIRVATKRPDCFGLYTPDDPDCWQCYHEEACHDCDDQ